MQNSERKAWNSKLKSIAALKRTWQVLQYNTFPM